MKIEPHLGEGNIHTGWWITEYGYHLDRLINRPIPNDKLYTTLTIQTNNQPIDQPIEVYISPGYAQSFEAIWDAYLADWRGHQAEGFHIMTDDESSRLWLTPDMLAPVWPWLPRAVRYMAITPAIVCQPLPRAVVMGIGAFDRTVWAIRNGKKPWNYEPEASIWALPGN